MSATAHYSGPDNAVGLLAQCELSGYIKLAFGGGNFYTDLAPPATVGVVRWRSAGDTAGYRLRRPKLTPVRLLSMGHSGRVTILANRDP